MSKTKYFKKSYKAHYLQLCNDIVEQKEIVATTDLERLNLIKSLAPIVGSNLKNDAIEKIVNKMSGTENISINQIFDINENIKNDIDVLKYILINYDRDFHKEKIKHHIEDVESNIPCDILHTDNLSIVDVFEYVSEQAKLIKESSKISFSIESEKQTLIVSILDYYNQKIRNDGSITMWVFYYDNLIVADNLRIQNNLFVLDIDKLSDIIEKLTPCD